MKKKKYLLAKVNLKLLYIENHIWSNRYKFWIKYRVKKPRLPNTTDENQRFVDLPNNCPSDYKSFIGN